MRAWALDYSSTWNKACARLESSLYQVSGCEYRGFRRRFRVRSTYMSKWAMPAAAASWRISTHASVEKSCSTVLSLSAQPCAREIRELMSGSVAMARGVCGLADPWRDCQKHVARSGWAHGPAWP